MLTNTLSSNLSLTSIVLKDNKVSENPQPKTRLKPSDTNASSVISHPKLPLVILRTDYLALAKNNHCAAKLLAILENWTNWFVRQGKFERWVRLTTEAISQHLLGEHNKAVIQKAITLLVSCGFIRREQRRKHRHDRSWFYWFDIERTQYAINALEPSIEPETDEYDLKMEATLERETRAAIVQPEMVNPVENDHLTLEKEAETRVVIDPPEMANRVAKNGQSNDQNQPIDEPKMVNLLIGISNKNLNSNNIAADMNSFEKKEEEKTNQEGSGLQIPASLIAETKPLDKPNDPEVGQSSAAAPVALKAVPSPTDLPVEVLEHPAPLVTFPLAESAPVDLLDEREALKEMRRLGIERNETVLALMKKKSDSLPNALAYIQQCQGKGETFGNITGAFVDALKKGKKPVNTEPSFVRHLELKPPTEQQLHALAEARSTGAVRDYFFSSIDNTHKVILLDGITHVPWCSYLGAVKP